MLGAASKVQGRSLTNAGSQHQAEATHASSAWWNIKGAVLYATAWSCQEHCVQLLHSHFQKNKVSKIESPNNSCNNNLECGKKINSLKVRTLWASVNLVSQGEG